MVCLADSRLSDEIIEHRMQELAFLVNTAGAEVISRHLQRRNSPDSATYIGKGKLEELALDVEINNIDLVVFEDELSPIQIRNIDDNIGARVLDRTAVILDIFAGRARSSEGKLQVELAQLKYILPRLTGYGKMLSRLGGGIGTRGPGETRLETDRRRIRKRIADLQKDIHQLRNRRSLQRRKRKRDGNYLVSLVGYTNAGKSTLLNALSGAETFTEDKFFATLDPIVRKVELENGQFFLLSDTVGFIRNLPPLVTEAFKATIEEIAEAALILHVIDASHPEYLQQIAAVKKVLAGIERDQQKELLIFNKTDKIKGNSLLRECLEREYPGSCFVSATKNKGLNELKEIIRNSMSEELCIATFMVPYHDHHFLQILYREGRIFEQEALPEGLLLRAEVSAEFLRLNYTYTGIKDNIREERGRTI